MSDGIETRVRVLLNEVYLPDGVEVWLNSPHQWLGGERAVDLLATGRGAEVLAAAQLLVDWPFG